ncbi:hypothetical protein ACHHYP_04325 [Achlya hypogyna]|uniref:Uncharacterized protein n=1 Tax=Achlya hypogyna TaxID=1202772 RepID=A0A1V9ZPC2_ACHHY|nr:hypothetical protein ACHHYP_04325 [Achlya hypogyna]
MVHYMSKAAPWYRRSATMNFLATDCFVECYCNGQLDTTLRLSLLSGLDRQENDPARAITEVPNVSGYTVYTWSKRPGPWAARADGYQLERPLVAAARLPLGTRTPYVVRRDRSSHVLRFLLVLNLTSMSMKAYLSEPFPWSQPTVAPRTFDNFTTFNLSTLTLVQMLYSRRTLPKDTNYYYDAMNNTHILRTIVHRPTPITSSNCVRDFITGLSASDFVSPAIHAALCVCAAATNLTDCNGRGSCHYDKMLNNLNGHACMWTTNGDDIQGIDAPNTITVTHAYTPYIVLSQWRWLTFLYRSGMTLVVVYLVHTRYHVHVNALEKILRRHGHRVGLTGEWSYTLVIGDPTVLILTNPIVTLGFVLDVWLSTDNVGVATLRTTQTKDLWLAVRTFMYLSRIVWFAYASLSLTNIILKTCHAEHKFAPVDPTVVAVGVAIYCYAFSWLAQNVAVFVELFQYLYTCLVPPALQGQQIELILGCSAFTALNTMAPLLYGFLRACFGTTNVITVTQECLGAQRGRDGILASRYQSATYTNLKNRTMLLFVCARTKRNEAGSILGGTSHHLCALAPRYKCCATMNSRATDCFVLCHRDGKLDTTLRLSLLSNLDLHLTQPKVAVTDAPEPSPLVVHRLVPGTGPRNFTACPYQLERSPMKAYISEYLPWNALPPVATTFANFTEFNVTTLSTQQSIFNWKTLPEGVTYFYDAATNAHVLRQALPMAYRRPVPEEDCIASFLLGMPGVVFFGPAIRRFLCAFAAVSHNDTATAFLWHHRGSCTYDRMLGADNGFACVWLTAGNDLGGNASDTTIYTLHHVYTPARYTVYLWFKFGYRVGTTVVLVYLLWTQYYRHVWALEATLRRWGHMTNCGDNHRYCLVVGDPTAVILTHPFVTILFVFDVWLSTDAIGVAILRTSQTEDAFIMVITFLYLSRIVWFAYAALCAVDWYLKRYKKEHTFAPVDPTAVAIVVAIYGSVLSYLGGNLVILLELYLFFFELLIPSHRQDQEIELALGCIGYTLIMSFVPLSYGFCVPYLRRQKPKNKPFDDFSSFSFTNFKNRVLLEVLRPFYHVPSYATNNDIGGSIYHVFALDPRYKTYPTVSFRATDCFLLVYTDDHLNYKCRLSLLSTLDTHVDDANLKVTESLELSPYTVNVVAHSRGPCAPGRGSARVSIQRPRPMKAYVTEVMPWLSVPEVQTFANFTQFNTSMLRSFQLSYNQSSLPPTADYYEDPVHSGYVLREVLTMLDPVSPSDCLHRVLVGLPGAIFYGPPFDALVCNFAAANHSPSSVWEWDGRGCCMEQTFMGVPWIYQCLWLSAGDVFALTARSGSPQAATLTYAARPYPLRAWQWVKFSFRVLHTMYIARRLWKNYYVHCASLAASLADSGHRVQHQRKGTWHYEVILGDPTAMILTDPWVAFAFLLDIWSSYDTLTFAVLRASQNQDVYVMLVAFLYLSRTVWAPYLALCVVSVGLKRMRMEHRFAQVDPTAVAIASAIYGPAMTWCMGNVAFLLDMYNYLGRILLSTERHSETFEAFPDVFLYTISLGTLPLTYGFLKAAINCAIGELKFEMMCIARRLQCCDRNQIHQLFVQSGKEPGDWWQRASVHSALAEAGGSVYALFTISPRYERCPTISFRATDCFVLCYCDGVLCERLRLTLLATLDRNQDDPNLRVMSSSKPSPYFPMKAYVTETLPGLSVPSFQPFANFTHFNTTSLHDFQLAYNLSTLPSGAAYYEDPVHGGYVLREALLISRPVLPSDCLRRVLVNLPGAIFFGPVFDTLVCSFTAINHSASSILAWDGRGSCMEQTFMGMPWIYQCLWFVAGDFYTPISASGLPQVITLTYAARPYPFWTWLWLKFSFRVVHTAYIARRLWANYYVHCASLAKSLADSGHRVLQQPIGAWHYEIMVGDPTAMILTDPWIAFAFLVDIWSSYDTLTFAVLRATQNDDVPVMLAAFLYLSRTVWVPYLALCIVSVGLKRLKMEHRFVHVDPTAVAIASAIYGPALTWCMGNVAFLLKLYTYLGHMLLPTNMHSERFEAFPDVLFYSVSLASLPVLFGFRFLTAAAMCIHKAVVGPKFASFNYNPIKNRVLFSIMQWWQRSRVQPSVPEYGGTVYALFTDSPRYQRSPTISFRATDCFVLCYYDGILSERLRLTLLTTLDLNESDGSLSVKSSSEPSPYVVNTLQLTPMGEAPPMSHGIERPTLLLSQPRSVWCI